MFKLSFGRFSFSAVPKFTFAVMKFFDTLRSSFFCLLFICALSGCGGEKSVRLDKDDIRIAGFYSGITPHDGGAGLVLLNSTDIDELLLSHALTRESLARKREVYMRNPELWRSVLELVRVNIRKKTGAEQ